MFSTGFFRKPFRFFDYTARNDVECLAGLAVARNLQHAVPAFVPAGLSGLPFRKARIEKPGHFLVFRQTPPAEPFVEPRRLGHQTCERADLLQAQTTARAEAGIGLFGPETPHQVIIMQSHYDFRGHVLKHALGKKTERVPFHVHLKRKADRAEIRLFEDAVEPRPRIPPAVHVHQRKHARQESSHVCHLPG